MKLYRNVLKRPFDFIASLIIFILLFPVFLLVAIILFFANGGHPFFIQRRPGKGGVIFNLVKFRTMNQKKDMAGHLLPDECRLTSIGKVVRKSSLDELPQLLNVILGNMSLVGPRPLLIQYLSKYSTQENRRHEVRPGITGWAQVNGRNAISWTQKFKYDVWYVDHLSFALDLKILVSTVKNVFRSKGITHKGYATMPFFDGNNGE
jgi:lipopolysaccharide/colanic/teichoic acid biosynthesis glycosyltransferase